MDREKDGVPAAGTAASGPVRLESWHRGALLRALHFGSARLACDFLDAELEMSRRPAPPPPGPRDRSGQVVPPPMRIVRKGWWTHHELSRSEAEADCLRGAARLAGARLAADRDEQARLLEEAYRNRVWGAYYERLSNRVYL